ncbi:MAG TPA: cytochrome P450 [Pseudonocardiaceae bacterium]
MDSLAALRVDTLRYLTDATRRRQDPLGPARELAAGAPLLNLGAAWVASSHQLVSELSVDRRLSMDAREIGRTIRFAQPDNLNHLFGLMLNVRDGADHHRLRRLTTGVFSARRVAELTRTVRDLVADTLDTVGENGLLDVIGDLGVRLPVRMNCELLGIPAQHTERVLHWAKALTRQINRTGQTAAELAEIETVFAGFRAYFTDLLRDGARDGILGRLVEAHEQAVIDDEELLAFVVTLLTNGLDTLTSALGTLLYTVLGQPGLLPRLTDPELARAAFDEAMRLCSPVRVGARTVVQELTVLGQRIPAGSVMILYWAAANLDPEFVPEPNAFRLDRGRLKSYAFGHGPHHCLGAPLATLAGIEVLRQLAEHFPAARVDQDELAWQETLPFCAPEQLFVRLSTSDVAVVA